MMNQKPKLVIRTIIAKVQLVIGVIIAFLFGLVSLISISEYSQGDMPVVIFSLSITAGGAYLAFKGWKSDKLVKLFREYSARLAADPIHSLDNLAYATNKPVEAVFANVTKMIQAGYFVNAHIDMTRNLLVFAGHVQPQATAQNTTNVRYIVKTCSGCGATNKVAEGTVGDCEFCGAKLK